MGAQEELKQFMDLIMNRTEEIEKLDLFIKMRNGNTFKYNINRTKEFQLESKLREQKEKLLKYEAEVKHKLEKQKLQKELKETKNEKENQ